MFSFKTNVPEIDKENVSLYKASELLERIGNEPNPTANEFYAQLLDENFPVEDHEDLILAAISIEMMMNISETESLLGETVH